MEDIKNFKNQVLDILGITFNFDNNAFADKNKKDWLALKNSKGEYGVQNVSQGNFATNADVKKAVAKMIDNKIRNSVNSIIDVNPKIQAEKRKRQSDALHKELKTFTLDDILSKTKGFEVGKGFFQAKMETISKNDKEGRQFDLLSKEEKTQLKNQIVKEGGEGNALSFYTVRTKFAPEDKINSKFTFGDLFAGNDIFDRGGLLPGDILIAFKTDPSKYIDGTKVGEHLETAFDKTYGGKRNLGKSDSIKDTESGVDVSLKCYLTNTNLKTGSITANANIPKDKEVKFMFYNYDLTIKDFSPLFKGVVAVAVCRLNKKESGFIKKTQDAVKRYDSQGKIKNNIVSAKNLNWDKKTIYTLKKNIKNKLNTIDDLYIPSGETLETTKNKIISQIDNIDETDFILRKQTPETFYKAIEQIFKSVPDGKKATYSKEILNYINQVKKGSQKLKGSVETYFAY